MPYRLRVAELPMSPSQTLDNVSSDNIDNISDVSIDREMADLSSASANSASANSASTNSASKPSIVQPVVVVGSGPAGIRAVEEILKHDRSREVVLYGNEQWKPYNRILVTSLLTGDVKLSEMNNPVRLPETYQRYQYKLTQRDNCEIISINRAKKTVTDGSGREQPYSILLLALGSTPHLPSIKGLDKSGVYTFRGLDDAQVLAARRNRCRHVVVLGGGVLGLEAARAMRQYNTQVTVIEHASRLMIRQLDDTASELLRRDIERSNIKVLFRESVVAVEGNGRVESIVCRSGKTLRCDTLVVTAGIKPNTELAQAAGLSIGKGIRVDHRMVTSDPNIYAVGECAEHAGMVCGLVAPALEQASVAAASIAGHNVEYISTDPDTMLKLAGTHVVSIGQVGITEPASQFTTVTYQNPEANVYRKLFIRGGSLAGVIGYGPWPEVHQFKDAIRTNRHVWPWQAYSFSRNGILWSSQSLQPVELWPEQAVVCQCMAVTRGTLTSAVENGCTSVKALKNATSASNVCGTCEPLLQQLVNIDTATDTTTDTAPPKTIDKTLLWTALCGLLLCVALIALPPIPFNSSVQQSLQWDILWRSDIVKLVTGFGLLGLGVVASALSLRRRLPAIKLGKYSVWRVVHVSSGVLAAIALVAHTGLRAGHNLNLYLAICFIGLLLAGSITSAVSGLQNRLPRPVQAPIRSISIWAHIALLLPVPALLSFHILKYWWY